MNNSIKYFLLFIVSFSLLEANKIAVATKVNDLVEIVPTG